jgi:1-deoxy-D-xylulose-5-phosphate reductoisomerase
MHKVTILGSTGSIGKSTLEVIRYLNYKVFALAAGTNYQLLAKQVIKYQPEIVVTIDNKIKDQLFHTLKSSVRKLAILSGESGLCEIATADETDILVMAMSGTQGIIPLLKAIQRKKRITLSTKELLVSFGKIIMTEAKKYDAQILPIDSELVGLHQCLYGRSPDEIKRVIITASGGPFFRKKNLQNISIAHALNHPVWKMGRKITVDSATLANKGLEVIETARLFSIPSEKIAVLIHPQSIIHAMVEFNDNSLLASFSLPNMRGCIQYALTFPRRFKSLVKPLDLSVQKILEFYRPDMIRFPALKLAYQALKTNGIAPCVFNSANEIAVNSFLNGEISFTKIPKIIAKTLKTMPKINNPTLYDLLKYEKLASKYAESVI